MFKLSKGGSICKTCDDLIHTLDDLVLKKDLKGLVVFFAFVFVRSRRLSNSPTLSLWLRWTKQHNCEKKM